MFHCKHKWYWNNHATNGELFMCRFCNETRLMPLPKDENELKDYIEGNIN
jgi:hypothetical protein